jgi:hypothetical protein
MNTLRKKSGEKNPIHDSFFSFNLNKLHHRDERSLQIKLKNLKKLKKTLEDEKTSYVCRSAELKS